MENGGSGWGIHETFVEIEVVMSNKGCLAEKGASKYGESSMEWVIRSRSTCRVGTRIES